MHVGGALGGARVEDDLADLGAAGPDCLLDRLVGALAAGEVDVVEVLQVLVAEEVGEAPGRDVVGVEEQQLLEAGEAADELEPEGGDVLDVVEAELPQPVALADLLDHGVVVVAPLEPQHLQAVREGADDEADGATVKVAREHELLEILAHAHYALRVVVRERCQGPALGWVT